VVKTSYAARLVLPPPLYPRERGNFLVRDEDDSSLPFPSLEAPLRRALAVIQLGC